MLHKEDVLAALGRARLLPLPPDPTRIMPGAGRDAAGAPLGASSVAAEEVRDNGGLGARDNRGLGATVGELDNVGIGAAAGRHSFEGDASASDVRASTDSESGTPQQVPASRTATRNGGLLDPKIE